MRVKKASINVMVNIVTFIIGYLPLFIVRRVFFQTLGNDYLGLTSLFDNIIGYLSIMELGIGSAIVFSMYKPFAEGNKKKIKGYLDYYSKFYKITGLLILILGMMILPFLKFFVKNKIDITQVKYFFVLYLINTFISYLFSYKICILNVAQEGYKVSIATTISKLLIAILQVWSFYINPSFYAYIIIQIIVNLIYYGCINFYINRKFDWIKHTKGSISKDEKSSLVNNIRALFFHKIGYVFVASTDNLVISSFISLSAVGTFNSYNMIISALRRLIDTTIASLTASIGNLLVEEDSNESYKVHKRLFFVNFWVVSFVIILLVNVIKQTVVIWLGKDQIIDNFTLTIILLNAYFAMMRNSVESFKEAAGIFEQDKFSPLFEGGINLVSSIILVKLIGLPGVFLGTLISNLTVVFWVKPKMVYKYVFKKPLKNYFYMYIKYLVISLIPLSISYILTSSIREVNTIGALILNCLINTITINIIYLFIFRNSEEFKYFKGLALNIFGKFNFKGIMGKA